MRQSTFMSRLFTKVNTVWGGALICMALFALTSCENFLKGEETKREIVDAIEYNNAPTYTIKVIAIKNSGDIKTPAGEAITKKVTDTFTVKFDPDDNHQFIKWEAVLSDSNQIPCDYIEFEDETSLETKVTFKKADRNIVIRPQCPERLNVNFNLNDEGELYARDSSIVLTFNHTIPQACKDAVKINIPGLDEDKTAADYFLPAEINDKTITIRTKYSQTHSETDLIPIIQNGSKIITVTIPAKSVYYDNTDYSENLKVYLDKETTFRYTAGSQTSKKTEIQVTSENDQCTMYVNDVLWTGEPKKFSVGETIALRCKPVKGFSFCGWQFTHTYIKNGQNKTDIIPVASIGDLNLGISYDAGTEAKYGLDSETNIAQSKLTIDNYIDGTVSVSPVIFDTLDVSFNMADADKLYPRDSSIVLTFNNPVKEECLNKITVRIPGLPEGVSASDYFEAATINENTVTLKAKTGNGTVADMIPVTANGSTAISVIIPKEDFYYQTTTQSGTYNVGMNSEKIFTYTINSETTKKTKIKFHIESELVDFSTFRIGDDLYSETPVNYSAGKSFALNYKITDAYKFYGWHIIHTYTDSQSAEQSRTITLPDEASLLEELNLSVTYTDENVSQPIFTVEKAIEGQITIQPYVVKIATTSINIDGEHGTFTPGKGTNVYKVGVKNHIEFDAASDYAFLRWQVVNATTNEEIPLQNTLAEGYKQGNTWFLFTDATSSKTDFELIRVPETEEHINLVIRPVVAERPRIISTSPTYKPDGVYADTTIQVMFDNNMDENSIYYDENEINELIQLYQVSKFLYADSPENTKCYGYEKGGQKFYKNILITNSKNDINLNKSFSIPVFENPRTLSIPVDKTYPLTEGVRVSILLSDAFFTKKEGKDVSLSRSEKWQYLVNGETDNAPPTLDPTESENLIVKDSNGTELNSYDNDNKPVPFDINNIASWTYFAGGKFDLTLKVKDVNSVDSTFNVVYKKLYTTQNTTISPTIEKKIAIEYTNTFGDKAKHTGECYLEGLDDGVYSICFEIKDLSGNALQYPAPDLTPTSPTYRKATKFYYFCLDQTGPKIPAPTVTEPANTTDTLNLSWTPPASEKDYKQATIAYRKWESETQYTTKGPFEKGTNSCQITGLSAGTHYEIVARYEDYAGNISEVPVTGGAYTRPEAPKSVQVSTAHGTSVTLTCTKPDNGNFTKFRVRAKSGNDTEWQTITEQTPSNEGIAVITINDLEKGLKYDFEITSYDEAGDKSSLPYSTSTTETIYPSFVTTPNKTAATSIITTADEIYLVLLKPSVNNITGFIVTYSTDESFPNDPAITKTVTAPFTDTYTPVIIQNLTPGTGYYFNFQTYYVEESNVSEDNIYKGSISTDCAPVTNLNATAISNTSLNVTWTEPAGNYDSYTISYQQANTTTWKTQSVSKGNTNAIIEGLQGGLKYNIKVVVNGTYASSAVTKNGCQTCPNPVRNLNAQRTSGTSLIVSWSTPSGNSSNYNGYKIYYTENLQDLNTILEGGAIPASVTVLNEGKTMGSEALSSLTLNGLYYIMMETYIGNESSDTRLKTYTSPIGCSLALDNVQNLTASPVSTSEVQLTWNNPNIAFDGIRIYKQDTLLTETPLSNTTTSYNISGLTADTSYTLKVTIFKNLNGTELTSTAVVYGCTYSNPVTNVTASGKTPKSINLSWTNPASGTWTKLFIYANNELITQFAASENVSSCVCDVPSGGTLYNIKLVTLNRNSTENPNEFATTSIRTTPEPVTNLVCTETTKKVAKLSWENPTSNYSAIKVFYKTHNSNSWTSKGFTTSASDTSFDVTGLSAGTCYDFKVETFVSDGGVTYNNIGETSSTIIQNSYTKPNEPVNFKFHSRTANSITFTWSKPSGSFGGYTLYYKTSNNSYSSKTIASSETSYTLTGLSPATIYNVYLESYISDEANSSASSVLTKPTLPGIPKSFSVRASGVDTYVSWSAPTNGASGYNVYYKAPSASNWFGPMQTSSTNYTFANNILSNGVQYSFYVTAYKTVNSESLESEGTSTKTFYTPPAELNVTSTIYSDDGMGTIIIRWKNPNNRTDVTGINVYLDNSSTWQTYLNSFSAGNYVTAKLIIPNYTRGSSHTFTLEPYHNKNGSEVRGPKTGTTLTLSEKNLIVNGTSIEKTDLTRVISGNNIPVTNHPTDGGSFVYDPNTGYIRNVTLSQYSIGTYEVTNALWRAVTGDTYTSDNSYPKTGISWQQAIAFCNKLSAMQGLEPCYEIYGYENYDWKNFNMGNVPSTSDSNWYGCKQNLKKNGYHLPTCAQWEFAARGGDPSKTDFLYGVSGVYDWDVMSNYVVYGTSQASYVGSRKKNNLGLYDMCGNVWEMLTDWNNAWPGGTFTDPYCEVRYHGTGTGEWIEDTGQAIPYDTSRIVIYRAGGCYEDTAGRVAGDDNINLRVYATYTWTKKYNNSSYNFDGYFYAPTSDPYTGFRLCRNVVY